MGDITKVSFKYQDENVPTFILQCETFTPNNASNTSQSWLFGDEILTVNDNVKTTSRYTVARVESKSQFLLFISNTSIQDNGLYQCRQEFYINGQLYSDEKDIEVYVYFPSPGDPECSIQPSTTLIDESIAEFNCYVRNALATIISQLTLHYQNGSLLKLGKASVRRQVSMHENNVTFICHIRNIVTTNFYNCSVGPITVIPSPFINATSTITYDTTSPTTNITVEDPPVTSNSINSLVLFLIGSVVGALVVLLLTALCIFLYQRIISRNTNPQEMMPMNPITNIPNNPGIHGDRARYSTLSTYDSNYHQIGLEHNAHPVTNCSLFCTEGTSLDNSPMLSSAGILPQNITSTILVNNPEKCTASSRLHKIPVPIRVVDEATSFGFSSFTNPTVNQQNASSASFVPNEDKYETVPDQEILYNRKAVDTLYAAAYEFNTIKEHSSPGSHETAAWEQRDGHAADEQHQSNHALFYAIVHDESTSLKSSTGSHETPAWEHRDRHAAHEQHQSNHALFYAIVHDESTSLKSSTGSHDTPACEQRDGHAAHEQHHPNHAPFYAIVHDESKKGLNCGDISFPTLLAGSSGTGSLHQQPMHGPMTGQTSFYATIHRSNNSDDDVPTPNGTPFLHYGDTDMGNQQDVPSNSPVCSELSKPDSQGMDDDCEGVVDNIIYVSSDPSVNRLNSSSNEETEPIPNEVAIPQFNRMDTLNQRDMPPVHSELSRPDSQEMNDECEGVVDNIIYVSSNLSLK